MWCARAPGRYVLPQAMSRTCTGRIAGRTGTGTIEIAPK
jgi:hypothetical protein